MKSTQNKITIVKQNNRWIRQNKPFHHNSHLIESRQIKKVASFIKVQWQKKNGIGQPPVDFSPKVNCFRDWFDKTDGFEFDLGAKKKEEGQ